MPKYDICLFDMDGVLTDSKEGIINSVKFALDFMGVAMPDGAKLEKFIGPPIRRGFEELGIDDAKMEETVALYRKYLVDKGMFENALYPGIVKTLEELKQNGVIMAVATSKVAVYAKEILKYFQIDHYFSLVSGSEMDGRRSDKAEIIAYALDKLDGEHKMSAVMIGDRKYDIAGARANGIDSIGAAWGYAEDGELQKADGTVIINSPEEIIKIVIN